jgi:hypothetical protein
MNCQEISVRIAVSVLDLNFVHTVILDLSSVCFVSSPVCFKVFDSDRDGVLSGEELQHMIDVLLFVRHENKSPEELAGDPYGQAGE